MPVDFDAAKQILNDLWAAILVEADGEIDPTIDQLINSSQVSIRFCLPTQLLGKLSQPELDVLCLQKGDAADKSMWDPRGFASKVIVPWVADNQNVLGTSTDPYVSKPLRKPRLEKFPENVKKQSEWTNLFQVLDEVQTKSSAIFTRRRMLQALRSVRKKLTESTFEFHVPGRVSLDQTQGLITEFLSQGSGGDRGLAVAAALLETLGKFFGLYNEVRRHVINASDTSTGLTADIECVDSEGTLKLAAEVKERQLTLTDVKSAIVKVRKSSITEFLFNSPKVNPSEAKEIEELFRKTWASGTNLYMLSIFELIQVGLMLTGERGRKDFLLNVGEQLNKFNTQPANRQKWKELLEKI